MTTKQADFNNRAFVPYAIDGNETTYVPNNQTDTFDCKDDGYVKPFGGTEKNHEYENPADVAKRAGLHRGGSGPRRKKNALYGNTQKLHVDLPDTPTSENGGAELSPLVVTTSSHNARKPKRCRLKVVFLVVLLLFLSSAALAVSLWNMFKKDKCSCSSSEGLKVAAVVNDREVTTKPYTDPELVKKIEELQRNYEKLQKQVERQQQELTRLNKSDSTKPKIIKGLDGKPGKPGAAGPRGLRGKQGPPGIKGGRGERGFGNISRCSHKKIAKTQSVGIMASATYKSISYIEPQNAKVLSVVCSTTKTKGVANAYLDSKDESNGKMKYICDCAGTSVYGPFSGVNNTIECVMHIWECLL